MFRWNSLAAMVAGFAICAAGQAPHNLKSRLKAFSADSVVQTNADLAPHNSVVEMRQQIRFDAAHNVLTVKGRSISGSVSTNLWQYSVDVTRADVTDGQLAITGTVRDHSESASAGSMFAFTAAYSVENGQARFQGMTASVAGAGAFTSASGTGTVVVARDPQPLAIAGPKGTGTFNPVFFLDGSASSDPMNNAPLKYSWSFVAAAGKTASLRFADTARPLVTIDTNDFAYGDYLFQLTVTNAAGLSSTDLVDITYMSTDPVVPEPDPCS